MKSYGYWFLITLGVLVSACQPASESAVPVPAVSPEMVSDSPPPDAAAAAEFVARTEARLEELAQHSERMQWVMMNFITYDTGLLAASTSEAMIAAQVEAAAAAAEYVGVPGLDPDTARKLDMLRSGITIPAPGEPDKVAEQAAIGAQLSSLYGKGEYCREDGSCLALGELENILAQSRDPAVLLEVWNGWRGIAPPMKPLYARQVELANQGAKALGFDDLGTMWRSGYDMPPADFAAEMDQVWSQVQP